MGSAFARLLVLSLGLAVPVSAATKIKIDSVPPEYTPTADAQFPEPISMESFHFEVNKERTRARIVVEYTFPDESVYGHEGGLGPPKTYAQIPGLVFDPGAHAVIYEGDGDRTTCAIAPERKVHGRGQFDLKNTGLCTVTAKLTDHAEDDGWTIRRFRTIDTYFEIHGGLGLRH